MSYVDVTPGCTHRLRYLHGNPGEGSECAVPAGTILTVRELVRAGTKGGSALEDTVIVECESAGVSRAFGLTITECFDLLEPV